MPIEYAAILPHGFDLIENIYPKVTEEWLELRKKIQHVAEEVVKKNPEIILIASPHNLRIDSKIGIITSEWCEGILENEETDDFVKLKWECDRIFGRMIYERALEMNLPVVSVNYGAAEGEYSTMKMDWGTLIPLWFIKNEFEKKDLNIPKFILITPSREIPWTNLKNLGSLIEKLSNETNKQIVFIASSDHGHAHDSDGPYGFHTASKEFDEKVYQYIKDNKLDKIFEFTPEFIEDAKPDSLWQMLILLGIIENASLKNSECFYACPTYYGMIVADFKSY